MKAIIDNDRPAIIRTEIDESGEYVDVIYVMDLDQARLLRDGLTEVIKKCAKLEAIKHNQR